MASARSGEFRRFLYDCLWEPCPRWRHCRLGPTWAVWAPLRVGLCWGSGTGDRQPAAWLHFTAARVTPRRRLRCYSFSFVSSPPRSSDSITSGLAGISHGERCQEPTWGHTQRERLLGLWVLNSF